MEMSGRSRGETSRGFIIGPFRLLDFSITLAIACMPWVFLAIRDPDVVRGDSFLTFVFSVAVGVGIFLSLFHVPYGDFGTLFNVLCFASFIQGTFACFYFYLSALVPGSFTASITKFDAVFFAIATATTAGGTDIMAVSTFARSIVLLHILLSLFLILTGVGIAIERAIMAPNRTNQSPSMAAGPRSEEPTESSSATTVRRVNPRRSARPPTTRRWVGAPTRAGVRAQSGKRTGHGP